MQKPAKILVVEDEMIIAAKISMLLTQLGYEVAGIIPSGEEAIAFCRENPPDIILLDINLNGPIDGVEAATSILETHTIPIIYLTANSDEYNFKRAKSTKPFAFISKPLNKIDLQRAIELVAERLTDEMPEPEASVGPKAEDTILMNDRIFIRHKDSMVKVLLDDIVYLEAERSYCKVYTEKNDYLISSSLKALEDKLQDSQFIRIHRSYIINLKKIDKLTESHVFFGKKSISISKSYKENLLKRLRYI